MAIKKKLKNKTIASDLDSKLSDCEDGFFLISVDESDITYSVGVSEKNSMSDDY